jgi:hypothetical protein
MENAAHARGAGLGDHRARIIFRFAGMHDDRTIQLFRKLELQRECAALEIARRMIVVGVETAFTDRDGATAHEIADRVGIAGGIELSGVVRMDARGEKDEPRMRGGDGGRALGGGD